MLVRKKGLILITFAWSVEIVGVVAGFVNAVITTYPDGTLPTSLWPWLMVLPMGMIAVAELGRVPLTSVLFYRHKVMQAIALIGIVFLAGLAFENWTFGFERIVELRLKPVSKAKLDLKNASDKLSDLEKARDYTATSNTKRREQLDIELENVENQIKSEHNNHSVAMQEITNSCKLTIYRYKCLSHISQQQNQENQRFDSNIKSLYQRRDYLNQKLISDNQDNTKNDTDIAKARRDKSDAQKVLAEQISQNQIYRLAAMWYRISPTDVSVAQFEFVRFWFSTFSALAVALAGTVSAFVYYARQRIPGETLLSRLFAKLLQARRAYYARKRRSVYRDVPVEIDKEKIIYRDVPVEKIVYRDGKEIVEKEVPKWIDRIVLIPRWGVKTPIHVNSLIRNERTNGNASDGRVRDGEDGRVGDGDGRVGDGEDGRVGDGR